MNNNLIEALKYHYYSKYLKDRSKASRKLSRELNVLFKSVLSIRKFNKILLESFFVNTLTSNINYDLIIENLNSEAIEHAKKIEEQNIDVILCEDYESNKFMKHIDKYETRFLFYIGKKHIFNEIMDLRIDDSFSVVGSRKTEGIYARGIKERMPNKRVMVSGMAYGADLIGHREAMKMNKKIVIFPGFDIVNNAPAKKRDVGEYAKTNGLIFSSIIPFTKAYIPAELLKRNRQMAQVISESYVLYFNGRSGTLGHMLEVCKQDKEIFMPVNVYNDNLEYLFEKNNLFSNNLAFKKNMRYK